MKMKRDESIHNFFMPIGSRPCEHDANANDLQPSQENFPYPAEDDYEPDHCFSQHKLD
jgi:hypothetical protein